MDSPSGGSWSGAAFPARPRQTIGPVADSHHGRPLSFSALFAHNKVLGTEWEGFRVIGDRIYFPDGRWISQGELMGYEYVHQLAQLADSTRYRLIASDMLNARTLAESRRR